jgi:DNA anti-recombination protein RmuC
LKAKRGADRGLRERVNRRIQRRLAGRLAQLEEIIKKLFILLDDFQECTKLS